MASGAPGAAPWTLSLGFGAFLGFSFLLGERKVPLFACRWMVLSKLFQSRCCPLLFRAGYISIAETFAPSIYYYY